jgi:8-oxo-dGTP pyrophosphatase MutT (NUDIX family)
MLEADIDRVMTEYLEHFPGDQPTIAELRGLRESGAKIISRKEFRGHVTCGGIVIGGNRKLLMIHHRSLDKWLFPGGHLEESDTSLRGAAMREIGEETGISSDALNALGDVMSRIPIHVDCHTIPANPSKQEPAHRHFDFRFVFAGEPGQIHLQTEEVCAWEWVDGARAPKAIQERLQRLNLI